MTVGKEENNDRRLQIRIAQLNADLQVYVAFIFGAIAGAVTFIVFGYQLVVSSSLTRLGAIISIVVFGVATGLLGSASWLIPKLKRCLNDFKALQ